MKDTTRSILAGDRSPTNGYASRFHIGCGRRCIVKREHGDTQFVCAQHGNVDRDAVRRGS